MPSYLYDCLPKAEIRNVVLLFFKEAVNESSINGYKNHLKIDETNFFKAFSVLFYATITSKF